MISKILGCQVLELSPFNCDYLNCYWKNIFPCLTYISVESKVGSNCKQITYTCSYDHLNTLNFFVVYLF